MTKKIVEEGTDTYKKRCPECGTLFLYEREDIHSFRFDGERHVSCPRCKTLIEHRSPFR
jgi:predicted Zn finger-like uncharacterized protein